MILMWLVSVKSISKMINGELSLFTHPTHCSSGVYMFTLEPLNQTLPVYLILPHHRHCKKTLKTNLPLHIAKVHNLFKIHNNPLFLVNLIFNKFLNNNYLYWNLILYLNHTFLIRYNSKQNTKK